MKLQEFRFTSRNGHTKLHAMAWIPDATIHGLIHICHGLNGHIAQYETLAKYLAEQGYLVFGHDILGHGLSAEFQDDLGYFGPARGDDYVLGDILILNRYIQELYPTKPLILLGHAMGTYFVRRFLITWPDEADAAVLVATNSIRHGRYIANNVLMTLAGILRPERYRPKGKSAAVIHLLNNRQVPHRSDFEWVCQNPRLISEQGKDPFSNFLPTLRVYRDINHSLGILARDELVLQMKKKMPILIMYCEEDPLGKFGFEAKRLASVYKQADMEFVSLRGYSGKDFSSEPEGICRAVRADLLTWLEACQSLMGESF